MTVHSASIRPAAVHAHHFARAATGVATGLLVVASTWALGAAATGPAVLAIAVLSPLVLFGTVTLARDE